MSKLADAVRRCAEYLDALADNILENDADMLLDECRDPKDVANELRAALAADGWQPIETAPRTGVTVQVFQPWRSGCDEIMMAHYANGWVWQAACDRCGVREIKPTHWQPLPSPPKE